jgi:radical SAM superfamily enzyme YgiQ (UPF0313 family)
MKVALISSEWGTRLETLKKFPELREYSELVTKIGDRSSIYRNGIGSALPTVACYMPSDTEIEIIDERFQEIDFSKKYDLVGLTLMTSQAVRAYEIADEFRRRGVKVVLGGVHPTVMPEEAKEHCNSVVVGEAEKTWPMVIEDYQRNDLKPYYEMEEPVDVTTIPTPRYDLLSNSGFYTLIWIQTSRGCPHDCEYCIVSRINGKRIRSKTPEQVVNEIKSLKQYFGDIAIGFGDDNMLARSNRKAAKLILREIIPLKIRWYGFSDVSIAKDEEMLDLARESGCRSLLLGFESINAASLQNISKSNWKYRQLEKYADVVEKIQSKGIGIMGSFIMGLDGDTFETFDQTRDFIKNTHLFAYFPNVITPFPGTRLRERYVKEDRILATGWDNYTKNGINIIPKNMSVKEFAGKMIELLHELFDDKDLVIANLKYFRELARKNNWT